MSKNKLLIIGAGGHGRAVAEAAELSANWKEIAFLDDSFLTKNKCWKWDIVGAISNINEICQRFDYAVVAIGNQNIREFFLNDLLKTEIKIASIIHPGAFISSGATIGDGSVILAGAVIGPQANLGTGVIVNINSAIDHDVTLGNFVHLGVGVKIAGGAVVSDKAWLQAGVTVGIGYKVDAGAVVSPGKILHL